MISRRCSISASKAAPVLASPSSGAGVAFLGILPMRDDDKDGVEIRYVYPKSPAETAGLKVGDRITKAAGNRPAGMAARHRTAVAAEAALISAEALF